MPRKKLGDRSMNVALAEPVVAVEVDPLAELTIEDLNRCVAKRSPLTPRTERILRTYFTYRGNPAYRAAEQARQLQITVNKVASAERRSLQLLLLHVKGSN
ncbi:MAG TPA: hypothetical protein ENH94_00315 [Phycisphaerales bacterium]|nr:hypothetical protein [Phycisphaerales bacterium]